MWIFFSFFRGQGRGGGFEVGENLKKNRNVDFFSSFFLSKGRWCWVSEFFLTKNLNLGKNWGRGCVGRGRVSDFF